MFTPPPSPFPPSQVRYPVPPPPTPSPVDCELGSLKLTNAVSQPPTFAQLGPSRIINHAKKKTGRRILLTVALAPALFIIVALWRHYFSSPRFTHGVLRPAPWSPMKRSTESSTSTSPTSTSASDPLPPTLPTVPNPPVLTQALPQPFDDSTFLANFSTIGCQNFFTTFLQDPDFRQCRAFSFLLNSSGGFISAQSNVSSFNEILGATCNTPPTFDDCDQRMSDFLDQLNGNCTQDISLRNPIVLQAQISFQSYTAMRLSSCLQDPAVNVYCYIEALSGAEKFGDIYLYGIPLGTPVPGNVNLSCSSCSRTVLSIYSQFVNPMGTTPFNVGGSTSGNSSVSSIVPSALPVLSVTYPDTAHLAITECGGKFASVGITQNSAHCSKGTNVLSILLALAVSLWMV